MERWDHASLLAGGSSPAKASLALEDPWCDTTSEPASEPESPIGEGWTLLDYATFRTKLEPTVKHSGWLLKAYGSGPQRQWRRRYVYVLADRLCYTPDPGADGGHCPLRYLPLDRIPVRALPRGYGPKLGVTLVEDRQVDRSSAQFSPKKAGCVFSVACGSHTHFFSAPSPTEAKAWVAAITECWLSCVKHTARGTHFPSAEEVLALKEARWQAESQALRRSLAEAEQARLRESTAQWQAAAAAAALQTAQPEGLPVACYEIEVETGAQPGAGTTARVYMELCGTAGSSGDHRLMYRDGSSGAAPTSGFAEGAVDKFKLHCQPLGELVKVRVYHNNGGASPAWFLREVRVRQQGGPRWTHFPCNRWLAVDQDDSRVLRELFSNEHQPQPALQAAAPQQVTQEAPAERVVQPVWYTVVVCTSGQEGAGLSPAEGAAVSLVLHGSRGSSSRVKLPAQSGDFERGQEGVFRVQLPCVGSLEKLTVGLSSALAGERGSWLLEQVEVTDEASGETVFFPCSAWLGQAKGAAERTLLGSRSNPREAQQEVARLRQQLEAANRQLAAAQAEVAEARAAASGAQQASQGHEAEMEVKLATLQAEVAHLQKLLKEAQQRAAAAEARVEQLQVELQGAESRADALQREQDTGRERAGADASRAAELAGQLRALQEELASAQEAAAAAAAKARRFESDARRCEEELQELRGQQVRSQTQTAARLAQAEEQLRRLQAEVAATSAELQDAKAAEREAADECDRLSRELAAERLRAKERAAALERLEEEADRAAAACHAPAASSAQLLASYRVCIRTSSEPPSAGTTRPVCLELLGTGGSTGPIHLPREGSGSACFTAGSANLFQLEAPAVGELQQLNVWLDLEATGPAEPESRWHLDTVEVSCTGRPPAYFVCRKWLDARNQHRAELAASARNPRQEDAEYKVVVFTSSIAGCGTGGNVFVDLRGDVAPSGVLTLRNKGGSFRPGQADDFTFRLPALGALSELRVGHDGRKEWHLDRVEVVEPGSGTTYFFPCEQWLKGSGPGSSQPRSLQLRGYTTDPRSLPVQYRAEVAVEEVAGRLGSDSLRLTLCGSRGEGEVQRLDASHALPGRPLVAMFEGANVGQMERLRIGLAPGQGGQQCGLRVSSLRVTNMPSGEAATFYCSEWLRSSDPYDFEVDAAEEQEELSCTYRLEVQTSDVRRAGTSGNVYVTIVGDACAIGPYQLTNVESEHFQRDQLDVFEVEGAPDCGQLRQIEVRHDGAGRGNDWHLSWVKVSNLTTGAMAMFKCKRWVDRRRSEDPGAVAAASPLPPDAAAAAGGRLSAKDRLLLSGSIKASLAAAAAHAPMVQASRMEADAYGQGPVEYTQEGVEGGQLAPPQPAGLPGYRAVFHTSRVCGSGTKAKVHFELTGSGGSSGVLHPKGTSKSFGAGRVDIFEYPQLPCLGELQSARVGTDGSGLFPAWHLQLLVVTHLPTGRVWQFSCFNWIDKRSNYSRWLTLDSIQEGAYGGSSHATSTKLGAAWQSPYGLKPAPLVQASGSVHGSPYRGSAGGSPRHHSVQSSPTASPLRYKQQAGSPTRPGSPIRVQVPTRQQWGGGSSTHAMLRSGSGMPGSPLIGARRPGSGR